jgi:putative transposase
MQFMLQPYHILLAALIGWANERQQQIIEFQNDQIKALLKKLGKKRVLLTDDQRRVLAVKGRAFGARGGLKQGERCRS